MPKAAKLSDFTLVPEVVEVKGQQITVGMRATGVMYFEEFSKEKAGASYDIPLKARSADGANLYDVNADDYDEQEILTNPAGETLYVNKDHTLTTDPWLANGRDLKPTSLAVPKQATSWTGKNFKIVAPEIVWPDGNMRNISVKVKANAPQLPEEYLASKQAAGAQRAQATVTKIDPSKLAARQFDEHLLKMLQENAVRTKQQFVCPPNLQYLLDERTAEASRIIPQGTNPGQQPTA